MVQIEEVAREILRPIWASVNREFPVTALWGNPVLAGELNGTGSRTESLIPVLETLLNCLLPAYKPKALTRNAAICARVTGSAGQ